MNLRSLFQRQKLNYDAFLRMLQNYEEWEKTRDQPVQVPRVPTSTPKVVELLKQATEEGKPKPASKPGTTPESSVGGIGDIKLI